LVHRPLVPLFFPGGRVLCSSCTSPPTSSVFIVGACCRPPFVSRGFAIDLTVVCQRKRTLQYALYLIHIFYGPPNTIPPRWLRYLPGLRQHRSAVYVSERRVVSPLCKTLPPCHMESPIKNARQRQFFRGREIITCPGPHRNLSGPGTVEDMVILSSFWVVGGGGGGGGWGGLVFFFLFVGGWYSGSKYAGCRPRVSRFSRNPRSFFRALDGKAVFSSVFDRESTPRTLLQLLPHESWALIGKSVGLSPLQSRNVPQRCTSRDSPLQNVPHGPTPSLR